MMKNMNFVRVAAANIDLKVADCSHNKRKLLEKINEAWNKGIEIIAFPELTITGYTCGDLFFQKFLLGESESAIKDIMELTSDKDMLIAISLPRLIITAQLYSLLLNSIGAPIAISISLSEVSSILSLIALSLSPNKNF